MVVRFFWVFKRPKPQLRCSSLPSNKGSELQRIPKLQYLKTLYCQIKRNGSIAWTRYHTLMAYTQNPHMPKVRQEAAAMVHRGYTPTEVGRRYGVGSSTICKWVKKAQVYGYHPIPTQSSRPRTHPAQLSSTVTDAIAKERLKRGRCAEVVHENIRKNGIEVSLSSVKRTLARRHLLKKRSPWKRFHPHVDRPRIEHPGSLVQLDTIHTMTGPKTRIYTFTLIDVCSRFTHAKSFAKMNAATSLRFLAEAQALAGFSFRMLQTDHGPEFGTWFVSQTKIPHRYTRLGKPNDNVHIERFNRTLQEECLDKELRTPSSFNRALKKYLKYYNQERLHLGLNLLSPLQFLTECVQAID
jgi:putative transposase